MKISVLFCLACWSWLVVQPLLSQSTQTAADWYGKSGVGLLPAEGGTLIPVQTAQGVSNNCKLRAVKRLMNGHCGDGTIRLVKITAGCCTKITSYVASRPAPGMVLRGVFC